MKNTPEFILYNYYYAFLETEPCKVAPADLELIGSSDPLASVNLEVSISGLGQLLVLRNKVQTWVEADSLYFRTH